MIYIFPYLSIDTQLGHIFGHIAIWRNGHYGHYSLTIYGHEYGQDGCPFKVMENFRSPAKGFLLSGPNFEYALNGICPQHILTPEVSK